METTANVATGLDVIRAAVIAAKNIVARLTASEAATPDVAEARLVELKKLNKDELMAHILTLEAPKADKGLSVVDIITAICTAEECKPLNYEQVAIMCRAALPSAKTTSKSVASVACKQGKELGFLPREKVKLDMMAML